jgi:Protein of unknown function (DUF1592)/Protein of unknown function (DUF1588)/Protein of unknown function (DUF1587)/Protein of unknown function (DUF1595)/Protein of unknown function (DUF1585)
MRRIKFGLLLVSFAVGCTGVIGSGSTGSPGASGSDPANPANPTGTTNPANPGNSTSPADATGHYALRRLTNQEYTNTVQALLFTQQTPGSTFQESLPGASGYTNDSQALDISSELVASYYAAATALATEVIASKTTAGGEYSKLVTCDATQTACAQQTVSALAKRALRRPVTAADLDATSGLMSVFSASGTFDQGLYDVIVSLLMHPEFLMIPVVNAASLDPTAIFALNDYEVASRLSYFLWQTMPDDALSADADQGKLHDPDVLRTEVTRMLTDTRATNLKNVLRDEYAGLLSLERTDLTQLGQTNDLRDAMVGETDAFLADIVSNDRSALTLLTGTQSFVNKTLADWYGLSFPAGQDPATFVALASNRTGIGSHASVLVNSAGGSPTFTNPIKRGHWLANKLLCINPPPPPPNVPPLPPATDANPTVRERLAAHLATPSCTACHVAMDAVGLGAENYGPFGQWRTTYDDQTTVDASGTLPGETTTFSDSASMYKALGTSDTAKTCVALQFMELALSRALTTDADQSAASTIAASAVTTTSHFSDLIWNIVTTKDFLQQTGEAP